MNRKELNPEASASAAFGERLRRLRDERGWTQDELAQRAGYSGAHISAVETDRKSPTLPFAHRIDKSFGTGDLFQRMCRAVRQTALLEGFPEFVRYESQAAEIRLYEVGVVPGLLQTPEYATVLADGAVKRGMITAQQARERVSLVAERQAVFARMHPPMVLAVLDESCIRRPVGPPSVMNAQLLRLMEFADRPNTVLQVAPFDMGATRPFDLPVTVLTLQDRSLISYAESAQRGHLEREIGDVLPMLTAYHFLQAEAISQTASAAMINKLRKGLS
ncbi:helix-turn-helix transcriptional regulator [Streptomyces sp. AM 2-1-1]|uniref:helix-turn-helix domain-containing protein n=1 Tax=Streptomyces sp. AM 2-1-1 TaxID=3028709 RepID=UPI0023B8A8CB|nr:helix-turn-helix transcriptional regulator [Streptomyces sp. AM 2-1-1]WEH40059.1 helix-turn-helix transcriptional regulator [Streptomyces sp. AM 2-1-1]